MDTGAGYLEDEEPINGTTTTTTNHNDQDDRREARHLEKIDEAYTKLIRKYRKRAEGAIPSDNLETSITGYQSLPELWQDFAPIILQVIHLKTPPPVQRLLNYTGDFHEFCGSFQQDTDEYEYKEYFEAMDYAWCRLLDLPTSQTDKVRIINILRDGQDKVARMGLHFEVYPHALDKAEEEEEQQAEEGD